MLHLIDTVQEYGTTEASLQCTVCWLNDTTATLSCSYIPKESHSLFVLSALHSAYVYVHACTCVNTIWLFSCCVNNLTPHDGSNLVLNHTTMAAGFFTSRAFLHDSHFLTLSGETVDPL